MALADHYDALMTPRVYKQGWTHAAVTAEMIRLKGSRFEPALIPARPQPCAGTKSQSGNTVEVDLPSNRRIPRECVPGTKREKR